MSSNFSDAPFRGHPINPLPPKYKYFVVQQFLDCESVRFTSKKHPTTKTCRFLVCNFLDTPFRGGLRCFISTASTLFYRYSIYAVLSVHHLCCFIGTASMLFYQYSIYAVCAGTFEISFSFSGHFVLVCLNSKQAPVESLYCTLFTLSGLGYTKILRLSGLVKYTNKIPMAKLTINIGMRIYLRILIVR